MKSIEIYGVGIRLIGVYLIFNCVQTALEYFQSLNIVGISDTHGMGLYLTIASIEVLFLAIAAAIFIKFPLTLAKWLSPASSTEDLSFSKNSNAILDVLVCLLGIYILSWAIPDLVDNSLFIHLNKDNEFQTQAVSDTYVALYTTVVEIGIGVCFAVWGSSFTNALRRVRSFGS